MEDFFANKINYKSLTFYKDHVEELKKLIKQESENGSAVFIKFLFGSIEIFALKTNETLLGLDKPHLVKFNIQVGYSDLFKILINSMINLNEVHLFLAHINEYNKLIGIFSKLSHSWLKFDSISRLLSILISNGAINSLATNDFSNLLEVLKIKLDFDQIKTEKYDELSLQEKESIKLESEKVYSTWRLCLECLFKSVSNDVFLENIESFQSYYK